MPASVAANRAPAAHVRAARRATDVIAPSVSAIASASAVESGMNLPAE
jgi:hypothetical protein